MCMYMFDSHFLAGEPRSNRRKVFTRSTGPVEQRTASLLRPRDPLSGGSRGTQGGACAHKGSGSAAKLLGCLQHELVGVRLAHAVRDGIPEAGGGECCNPNPHALRVPPTDTISRLVAQVSLCPIRRDTLALLV